jgi:hypothetical protein
MVRRHPAGSSQDIARQVWLFAPSGSTKNWNDGERVPGCNRHFPKEALSPYGLECLTADDFIRHQYHLNPDAFISVLMEQARDIGWTLPRLISKHVPSLSELIRLHDAML